MLRENTRVDEHRPKAFLQSLLASHLKSRTSLAVRFPVLNVWIDPLARAAPEAMAIDEWLLETTALPVLRVYRWDGAWGTLGYFGKLQTAMEALPNLQWVRRWTGGGTVDHRNDWTYTLAVPKAERLAQARAAESYRWIHQALAAALADEGLMTALSGGEISTGNALCFANPVSQDLISAAGTKLAGAGQRRTKLGLLHQGSVAAPLGDKPSDARARKFAAALAENLQEVQLTPDPAMLLQKIARRYRPLTLARSDHFHREAL